MKVLYSCNCCDPISPCGWPIPPSAPSLLLGINCSFLYVINCSLPPSLRSFLSLIPLPLPLLCLITFTPILALLWKKDRLKISDRIQEFERRVFRQNQSRAKSVCNQPQTIREGLKKYNTESVIMIIPPWTLPPLVLGNCYRLRFFFALFSDHLESQLTDITSFKK